MCGHWLLLVGNLNPKIQEASIHALVTLAGAPGLGMDFLAPHALAPIPAKKSGGAAANTAMAGRLELLLSLLNAQAQAAAMGGGKAQALALPSVQVSTGEGMGTVSDIIHHIVPSSIAGHDGVDGMLLACMYVCDA